MTVNILYNIYGKTRLRKDYIFGGKYKPLSLMRITCVLFAFMVITLVKIVLGNNTFHICLIFAYALKNKCKLNIMPCLLLNAILPTTLRQNAISSWQMHFEGKNVILFLLEQGAIGCSGRHWVKSRGLTPMGFKRVTKKGRAVIILFESFFFLVTRLKKNTWVV